MRWQPWSADVFAESAATGRPILLFLGTTWSRGCEHMLRATFADPRVIERIDRAVIPVWVDADERPDVAERYGLDGWPSTLLLTPEGEVLQGGTYFDAAALVRLLDLTLAAWRDAPQAIATRAALARSRRGQLSVDDGAHHAPGEPPPEALSGRIAASVAFPGSERFVHGDAIVFLLRHGSAASLAAGHEILQAADASPICRADGAVLRCARTPEWSPALDEITPDTHASALRAFAEASRLDDRYRSRVQRIAAFVRQAWLHRPSDLATDAGAELARASLAAAAALEDRELALEALAWTERIALSTYRPGSGVRHRAAEGAPAFASDQIALVLALLEAHELTEQSPYIMLAEELGRYLVSHFFDGVTGAIRDRLHGPDDVARLAEPLFPFCWNARAADALARLARTRGANDFDPVSARLVAWCGARWEAHGLDAATLGLALVNRERGQTPFLRST
ncbi:MAG TPA: DUF255 domain-containing protein [Gemmatimonadaceae bacterium]